jgi:hypothetical protein
MIDIALSTAVRRHLQVLLALVLSAPPLSIAQQAIDSAEVSESRVLVRDASKPGQPGKSFISATIIDAPLSRLCSIILNYSGYPGLMPNVEKTVVRRDAGDSSLVNMTLKLPMGKIKKYRLRMTPKTSAKSCELSWKLVPSEELKPEETIADTSGYWQLVPHSTDNGKTLVNYFVYTDPGPIPVGFGWIVDSLSKDSIPKTLEALRIRGTAR